MNNLNLDDLASERLEACGWTRDRRVDYSSIEKKFRDQNMNLPSVLREFFERFAFLGVEFPNGDDTDSHYFDPSCTFTYYSRRNFERLFESYGVPGLVYPIGTACKGEMTLYMHESGDFYMFMEAGPLIRIGNSIDSMLNCLIGDAWKNTAVYVVD